MKRLDYEESCRLLQQQGLLEAGAIPSLAHRPPRYDDEALGVEFFRTLVADARLENLTLPRTFFGRSEIRATSFKNTDLSGSTANWNDFNGVDFSEANLAGADLRANLFERVNFAGASLVGADVRYCGLKQCDFTGADLTDVKITRKAGTALNLSQEQQYSVDWQDEDGEEPAGG
jgi:uncharacterized protein YjbI with pentapeptide repeats